LWNATVFGEKCHFPYDCGQLLEDSTELLACTTAHAPPTFFGAHAVDLGNKHGWFFEFLQTVTDAHILKRLDQRRRNQVGLRYLRCSI
jgi:hypothetical protein